GSRESRRDVEAAVLEAHEGVEDVRDQKGRLAVGRRRVIGGRRVLPARVDEGPCRLSGPVPPVAPRLRAPARVPPAGGEGREGESQAEEPPRARRHGSPPSRDGEPTTGGVP